jgi:hypothetical protein
MHAKRLVDRKKKLARIGGRKVQNPFIGSLPIAPTEEAFLHWGLFPVLAQFTPQKDLEEWVSAWVQVRERVVVPLYERHGRNPTRVIGAWHHWLRNVARNGGVPYEKGAYSLFLGLEDQTGCNCLCSTLWILACSSVVGWFPGKVACVFAPNHAFVLRIRGSQVLETTCKQLKWRSMGEMQKRLHFRSGDHFYIARKPTQVLSRIVGNQVVARQEMTIQQQIRWVDSYPDRQSPQWWSLYMQLISYDPSVSAAAQEQVFSRFLKSLQGTAYIMLIGFPTFQALWPRWCGMARTFRSHSWFIALDDFLTGPLLRWVHLHQHKNPALVPGIRKMKRVLGTAVKRTYAQN